MNEERNDGFLSRWSRRKVQAREGQPLAEPAAVLAPAEPESEVERRPAAPALTDPQDSTAPQPEAPMPTLEDVQALTLDSDFKPFVARAVAPEVRNAAFRKLFSDPHFNVMDGLDIYIDDYTRPDPLPASVLAKLASAKFLRLVEEEPEAPAEGANAASSTEGQAADATTPTTADEQPSQEGAQDAVAQSDVCTDLPISTAPAGLTGAPADAHADLRLQPDDAAGRPAHRPGAE